MPVPPRPNAIETAIPMPEVPYIPETKLAEEVLAGRWFRPFSEGYVVAEQIVQEVDAAEADVENVLRGWVASGLVSETLLAGVYGAPRGPGYTPNHRLWRAREQLLRARGLRHDALLRQREHAVADIVIAIIMSTHIENARGTGSSWAFDTKRMPEELSFYLDAYAAEELAAAYEYLIKGTLVVKTKKHRVGQDVEAYDITARGTRE